MCTTKVASSSSSPTEGDEKDKIEKWRRFINRSIRNVIMKSKREFKLFSSSSESEESKGKGVVSKIDDSS